MKRIALGTPIVAAGWTGAVIASAREEVLCVQLHADVAGDDYRTFDRRQLWVSGGVAYVARDEVDAGVVIASWYRPTSFAELRAAIGAPRATLRGVSTPAAERSPSAPAEAR